MSLAGVQHDLRKDDKGWILVAVSFGWFFALGVRMSLPVLLPYISDDYDLTLALGGMLMSVMFAAYAIGQVPGGVLGDRIGERNILVGSMGLLTLGVVVIVFVPTLWGVLSGVVILSFGCGMFAPARFTILSDVFPEREGTAHGIGMASGDVGNTVLPVVAGMLAGTFVWQFGIGFVLPLLLILVVLLAVTIPKRTSAGVSASVVSMEMMRSIRRELTQRPVRIVVCLLLSQSMIYQGHTGLYPTYLIEAKGVSEEIASVLLGLFFGAASVTHLLAGMASDRFGDKPVIVVLLTTGVLAFGSLPFVADLRWIVIVTVLTGAPIGVITIALPYLIGQLSAEMQGAGFGVIRMLYILTAAFTPIVIGSLGEAGYFDGGFLLLSATAASALVVSLFLPGQQ